MADKELKSLNRKELLELLIEQEKENIRLKEEIDNLIIENQKRDILINNSESMAEAALRLNKVYEAADMACKQYVDNIKNISLQTEEQYKKIIEDAKKEAEKIIQNAIDDKDRYLNAPVSNMKHGLKNKLNLKKEETKEESTTFESSDKE